MDSITETNKNDDIIYMSFNQDYSCFILGTENGFKVYQTYPYKEPYIKNLGGGIGICQMLYRSNFLAFIGGGQIPKFNKNKVIIWDDFENKIVSELKFTTCVKNVKLKKDKIFIVCEKKIFVFNFDNYENIDSFDIDNKNGIIALNGSPDYTIMAYPLSKEEEKNNYIFVKNYNNNNHCTFLAQDTNISFLSMNFEGNIIASVNEKGTIIRLHNSIDGTLLQEFKRGIEKAEIGCICFNEKSSYMAVSSDRGTIHIWNIENLVNKLKEHNNKINNGENKINENSENSTEFGNSEKNMEKVENKGEEESSDDEKKDDDKKKESIIGKMFGFNKKSIMKIKIKEENSICAFVKDDLLVIISAAGMYYQVRIDYKGKTQFKIEKQINLNKNNKKK